MGSKQTKVTTQNKEKSQESNIDYCHIRDFCVCLIQILEYLGYSHDMIQYRREKNRHLDEIHNRKGFSVVNVTAGGKGEGTALYFESDIDRLYVLKGVVSVESGIQSSNPTVFQLNRCNCSPGYTRLKLIRENSRIIRNYIVTEDGEEYLSNSFSILDPNHAMIDINGLQIKMQGKMGPAARYGNTFTNYDFVAGFECHCPELLEKWVGRPRNYGWPDSDLVKKISKLEGHVVPVSNKGTIYPITEWRVCYTKAELVLMHSLEDCQTKSYILLKLIAKSVLNPLCSAMTSYIMKNVVFWMLETNSEEKFSQSFLIDRLLDALINLKEGIQSNVLRSYMIGERNLIEGRITKNEREALLRKIDELISEREILLQQCDKIRQALNKFKDSPEDFAKEAEKRDRIEKLILEKNIIFKETEYPKITVASLKNCLKQNETYKRYEEDLQKLVIPDKEELIEQGKCCEEVFRHRLFDILC